MDFHARRILVGIDFSECSTAALRAAKVIAEKFQSMIIAVHADTLERSLFSSALSARETVDQGREVLSHLQSYLGEQFDQASLPFIRILHMPPAEAILWTSRVEQCDLIVLGTHGRGGMSRLTLGSVAEQVLRRAVVPVLTVHGGVKDRAIRRILCPVNDSFLAGRALEHAGALARRFAAELIVLYLAESDQETGSVDAVAERLRVWIGEQGAALDGAKIVIRSGNTVERVIRYASCHRVDLMVIGAQHRLFSDKTVIGATTEQVTRHAPCPVLTVIEPDLETTGARQEADAQLATV